MRSRRLVSAASIAADASRPSGRRARYRPGSTTTAEQPETPLSCAATGEPQPDPGTPPTPVQWAQTGTNRDFGASTTVVRLARPTQNRKTHDFAGTSSNGARGTRTPDLLGAMRSGRHLERSRFGGPLLVAVEPCNGTRIRLFADFSGEFGTGSRALVPNEARPGLLRLLRVQCPDIAPLAVRKRRVQ